MSDDTDKIIALAQKLAQVEHWQAQRIRLLEKFDVDTEAILDELKPNHAYASMPILAQKVAAEYTRLQARVAELEAELAAARAERDQLAEAVSRFQRVTRYLRDLVAKMPGGQAMLAEIGMGDE